MKKIPYGLHHITDQDIEEVVKVLKSEFLTQGPTVAAFEQELASFLGSKHVIAVSNGTAALHLIALGLEVQPGDWVLCTANTFVASANCVRYCGGEVEFIDISSKTHCMDLGLLADHLKKSDKNFKGIIAVDFAGYPLDFEHLRKIADAHELWVIEDSCHALGAQFLDSSNSWVHSGNGKYADAAIFSFHPVKHIAMGEGGAISTNNDQLAARLRRLRSHGITREPNEISHPELGWYYEMQELGFNYRLSEMNAALGRSQLRRIESILSRRRQIAQMYDAVFISRGWVHATPPEKIRHAYHLYVIEVPMRKELYDYLRTKGIFSQVHYIPVTHQPYYLHRYGPVELQQTDSYYKSTLSLPMYPQLTDADVQFVIKSVLEFFDGQ